MLKITLNINQLSGTIRKAQSLGKRWKEKDMHDIGKYVSGAAPLMAGSQNLSE